MLCSATSNSSSYYSFYGLVQNETLLELLPAVPPENVWLRLGHCGNPLVVLPADTDCQCFRQQLRDDANALPDTLYAIDWPGMSIGNRKRIRVLMAGRYRLVAVVCSAGQNH